MHALPRLELFNADAESVPFLLAKLGQGSSAFLSCYLDTRNGQQACAEFLNRKAAQIRYTLRGTERFEFDTSVEMVRRTMETSWRAETQGMALFARGVAEDRQLTVLHSVTPLDNRLIHYTVPEVLPLIALHQREPGFNLLFVEDGRLRLFESRLGAEVSQVCLAQTEAIETLELATDATAVGSSPDGSRALPDIAWCLNKALGSTSLPLFVAGTTSALSNVAEWLPRRATERLVGSLQVRPGAGVEGVLLEARARLAAICDHESRRLADAVAHQRAPGFNARLGYQRTLEALRVENAEAVIIANWDSPGLGLPFETLVEICLLALRQGVRVVLANSISLREAGGVACLLRDSETLDERQGRDGDVTELERVA